MSQTSTETNDNQNYYVGWGVDDQLGGGKSIGYSDGTNFHVAITPYGFNFRDTDAKRMWSLLQQYNGLYLSQNDLKSLKTLINNYYSEDCKYSKLAADTSYNYFNNVDFEFYNYSFNGLSSEFYPYNSVSGGSTKLSPVPLDRAVCGKGVLISFTLTSDNSNGTFIPILNGYPQTLLGITPQSIVSGTHEYTFFSKIGDDVDSKQQVGFGLNICGFKGTLKLSNLKIFSDPFFVDYNNAYSDLEHFLNNANNEKSTSLQDDNFSELLNNYLTTKNSFSAIIHQRLSDELNQTKNILNDTTKTVAELSASKNVVNPDKLKSGSVSAFGTMDYNEIQTEAKALNLNTIIVSLLVYAKDATDSNPTVPDSAWQKAKQDCENLQKLGFNVILQPYPFINNGAIAETDWNPSDHNQFFTNYGKIVNDIATYAESQKLYGMFVATNLTHLEPDEDNWVSLINNLRSLYHGKLLFRTNWWKTASWAKDTVDAYNATLNRKFWQYVDVISIAAYFEVTDEQNPTSEQLQQELYSTEIFSRHQNIVQEIKSFNDKWNKPIFFGELGIPPYSDACKAPYQVQMDSQGTYNEQVQSNWFDAWYKVFSTYDWWLGYSIFTIGDKQSPYNPYGKEATNLIKMQTFGGSERPSIFIDQKAPNIPKHNDVWFCCNNVNQITSIQKWDGNKWVKYTL